MSTAQRTARFQRQPQAVGGLELQPRDVDIVHLVYAYRFVNSNHITSLITGSDQQIRRRLQKLFHHGYLDRPPLQRVDPLSPGSRKMVYGLSDKGAQLLAEQFGYDIAQIRWREKNSQVKHHYFQHVLMVSEFRACINLALQQHEEADLSFWQREDADVLKDTVQLPEQRGTRGYTPIVPDSYFSITDPGGAMYFFLEADRSTMTHKRFLRKMKGYWHWWRQGGHKQRFDINAFRVLTITKSEKRAENLRFITKKADERGVGSNMFWFTSAGSYSLAAPPTVLESIWQTPKDDEVKHHLLE